MHLGNVKSFVVSDGRVWADGGGFFGLVPKVLWEREVKPDELNRVPLALNCLLVLAGGKRIVVDTGYGDKLTPKQRQLLGLEGQAGLLENLRRLGYEPQDIDIVVNTHLHADHAAGNTTCLDGRVVPTFPRAEYWVQRREWQDATHPNERTRATYLAENVEPLADHGVLRLLDGDTEVAPGVRCVVTPGHTPGHQSVVLGDGQAWFLGDLAPWALNLERIAWVPAYDLAPMETIETRRRLINIALEQDPLLIFEHDLVRPLGRLRRLATRLQVEPLSAAEG